MATILLPSSKTKDATAKDPSLRAKIGPFISKLSTMATSSGLHLEPIRGARDRRVRTARVTDFYRAVLFELAADGECLIVRWDANSNGTWETSPAAAAESTGFRLRDGALETLRGASDCRGGGWEKITNPAAIVVTRFSVQRQVTPGFAPELSVTLAARSAQQTGLTSEVEQRVTGYNL